MEKKIISGKNKNKKEEFKNGASLSHTRCLLASGLCALWVPNFSLLLQKVVLKQKLLIAARPSIFGRCVFPSPGRKQNGRPRRRVRATKNH